MGKLVRDKIPQIITDAGKKPITEILDQERYLEELDKKLEEELAEYQADKSIEEMADVLEVLFAICEARGYSVDELMKVREEKCEKRGGFKERVYLVGCEGERNQGLKCYGNYADASKECSKYKECREKNEKL